MQKNVALCGILILCLAMGVGLVYGAESMYWDPDSRTSGDIGRQDFKFKYGSSESKSLGEMEVYDEGRTTREPRTISRPEPNAYTEPPLPAPPATPPLPGMNRPIRALPQMDDTRRPAPPTTSVRQSPPVRNEPTENTAGQDLLDRPEAVSGVIGKTPEKPPVSTMEVTRPPQKKMQWGRSEDTVNQTAEPQKEKRSFEESPSNQKFKWGR